MLSSKPVYIFHYIMQSNVRKEEKNKPYPPCVVCRGSGRVKCCHCQGRGLFLVLSLSYTHGCTQELTQAHVWISAHATCACTHTQFKLSTFCDPCNPHNN
uniref:Uncharacterized protein n=1 Tax=Nelumbo nucifera TaxID=4432 RepID=A0A822XDC3_NELNU|nr:TPA_asm: hypothetical protein HUJ06_019649 [Nelumbo nucifera]